MIRISLMVRLLLMLGCGLAFQANAVSSTLQGRSVSFSFDDALLDAYGTAYVSGDTLFFTPGTWAAVSLNGAGFDLAHATLNVRVSANQGHALGGVVMQSRGDYLIAGRDSRVGIGGELRAFDPGLPQTDAVATISVANSLSQQGLPTHDWSGSAMLDLSAAGTADLGVTLENLLLATSSVPNTLAFVEMKYVGLQVSTYAVPVPEADTWAMMLSGLGLIGFAVLRRGSSR